MDHKQLILIFALFGQVFLGRKRVDFGGLRDGLQTGSYYAEELTKGITSGNILQSVQNVFGLISQIHPAAGAVAGGVYFLLSIFGALEPTEDPLLVAIRDGVAVICRKLDGISNAIRDLEFAIKFEIRGLSIQEQVEDIEGLLFLQEQLIGKGDNESLFEYLNSCALTRIYEKSFWFANVLTDQNQIYLKQLILDSRDAYELNNYYQRIISVFFQSVVLASSCTTVRFRGVSNKMVQFYVDRKGENAEKLLKRIYENMKRDTDLIMNDFISYALDDVVKAAAKFDGKDIKLTFRYLDSTLNRKYNFRNWLVIVYGSSNTVGYAKHKYFPDKDNELIEKKEGKSVTYYQNFIRFHGANFVVATPADGPVDNDWKDRAYRCALNYIIDNGNCENFKEVKNCLDKKGLKYVVAGCVFDNHHMGTEKGNFVYVESGYLLIFVLK